MKFYGFVTQTEKRHATLSELYVDEFDTVRVCTLSKTDGKYIILHPFPPVEVPEWSHNFWLRIISNEPRGKCEPYKMQDFDLGPIPRKEKVMEAQYEMCVVEKRWLLKEEADKLPGVFKLIPGTGRERT